MMLGQQTIAFCPHCGNTAPQELCGFIRGSSFGEIESSFYLTQCKTCYEGLLYRRCDYGMGDADDYFSVKESSLVWPAPGELDPAVPAAVRKIYAEAALIKGRAPNAFANQIRRCLEAICKDRGASGRVLAENLKQLADRGEIPQTLATMTDVLRHLGNIASHAADEEIEPNYVPVIDEFFRAIVEYVYIAPHKLSEFKARLEYARQKGK